MNKKKAGSAFIALLACALAGQALTQGLGNKFNSNPDDVAKIGTSKDKLDETFHNVEIRQDGDLGLVTFNYDFVINDKVHHSGLEH